MKTSFKIGSLTLAMILTSCGAAAVDSKVLPTSATVSLDMPAGSGSALGNGAASCHPHLFERTFLAVGFFNGLTGLVFAGIADVIDSSKPKCTGKSCTWTLTGQSGLTFQVEVTPSGKEYDFTVSVQDSGGSPVQVVTGTVTPTDGQPHTGQGTMTFDFSQLASVDPTVKTAGQMTVNFNVNGANKVLDFILNNFTPDSTSAFLPAHNGEYVFARTQDVGGSFKFQESVDLWCPANANNEEATLQTVAVWNSLSGTFYGRADSLATGGQIPSGESWVGLTCANLSESTALAPDELYWMMKDEDSTGATVAPSPYCLNLNGDGGGQDSFGADCTAASPGANTCQPVFGAIPDPQSNATDFNFAGVNFNDGSVVPYPGQTGAADAG